MKTIVTHSNPDQDAIVSVWLIKRFFPGWGDAQVQFVPSGKTLNNMEPDSDSAVIHVDTGLGRFDHHKTGDRTLCAAKLVLDFIEEKGYVDDSESLVALRRMIQVVVEVDHALERLWPDPTNDRYDFFPEEIFHGLKSGSTPVTNDKLIALGLKMYDGIFQQFRLKVSADHAIQKGVKFSGPWGKGVGFETENDRAHVFAQREGYNIAVWKDPARGNVRIYVHPGATDIDLEPVYKETHRRDPQSDWFLHASHRLLLNGSRSNPVARPTTLSLSEIIGIIIHVTQRDS